MFIPFLLGGWYILCQLLCGKFWQHQTTNVELSRSDHMHMSRRVFTIKGPAVVENLVNGCHLLSNDVQSCLLPKPEQVTFRLLSLFSSLELGSVDE